MVESLIDLDKLLSSAAVYIFWIDRDNIYRGCNDAYAKVVGLFSCGDIVGKRNLELPIGIKDPKSISKWDKVNLEVMETGEQQILEEECTLMDGTMSVSLAHKVALRNEKKEVIGLLGIVTNITNQKLREYKLKEEKESAEFTLEYIVSHLPEHIYWKNKEGIYLGSNDQQARSLGFQCAQEIIGKTDFELPWGKESAQIFRENDMEVMNAGVAVTTEEPSVVDGKQALVLSRKVPLKTRTGEVVGIIGISIDITDRKEAEQEAARLKLENELQRIKVQEQARSRKIADQVVHDIRSPLASLLMIVKSFEEDIPEQARIALRDAATSIGDIANNLLDQYQYRGEKIDNIDSLAEGGRRSALVSLILTQVLGEKRHQYKDLLVKFSSSIGQDCNFTFVKIEPISFKRMLSNVINNAAESLEGAGGLVELLLEVDGDSVKIIVRDNGIGIPPDVINKIMDNIAVTYGKKKGHGIGFAQIREALSANEGKLAINSQINKGTEIILTFPIVEAPKWIAMEIRLNRGDMVVILDDDDSIHPAWESHFKRYGDKINLKHFTSGEEAINFINNFPEKDKIFLLTDFELLRQKLNGLRVIGRTNIKRSILVTSHYANLTIRNLAIESKTKILPKPIASEILIRIDAENKDSKVPV